VMDTLDAPLILTIATLGSALVVAAGLGWIFLFGGRRPRKAIDGRGWHRADAVLSALAMGAVFLATTSSLALLAASPYDPLRLRAATRTAEPHVSAATTRHTATAVAPAIMPLGPKVTAAVLRDTASVVRILGDAPSCGRTQEGSGFVVAPHRVMTNAHVVAGVRWPRVQVDGRGPTLPARVVLFDPTLDVAILDVPNLSAPPLPLATSAQPAGTGAEAAGYPQNGPFRLAPAVVSSTIDDVTPARGTVGPSTQQVYQLAALIRPGNSGGPLITPTGQVIGVVFARSTQNRHVGYALTADQVAFAATSASSLSRRVSTGRCSTTS